MTMGKNGTKRQILDVCCGGKMFYFDKANPLVHFCDIRTEEHVLCDGRSFTVSPDTVCNFNCLPFEDNQFSLIVFDPPHIIDGGDSSWLVKKYGKIPKDFKPLLTDGFRECFRCLKPNGTLIFKWNEEDIRVSEILKLTPFKPLLGHKSGKSSRTHWIVFFKDEDHEL